MATKSIRQPQSGLEIHRATFQSLASECGAMQCLLTHISQEAITDAFSHGEADPVDRDAIAKLKRQEWATSSHQQTLTTLLHGSNSLHQPSEHRFPPMAVPLAIIG